MNRMWREWESEREAFASRFRGKRWVCDLQTVPVVSPGDPYNEWDMELGPILVNIFFPQPVSGCCGCF